MQTHCKGLLNFHTLYERNLQKLIISILPFRIIICFAKDENPAYVNNLKRKNIFNTKQNLTRPFALKKLVCLCANCDSFFLFLLSLRITLYTRSLELGWSKSVSKQERTKTLSRHTHTFHILVKDIVKHNMGSTAWSISL